MNDRSRRCVWMAVGGHPANLAFERRQRRGERIPEVVGAQPFLSDVSPRVLETLLKSAERTAPT